VRDKERESVCVCIYIVFEANGILVSVAHDDQDASLPSCAGRSFMRERERERGREREMWTGN